MEIFYATRIEFLVSGQSMSPTILDKEEGMGITFMRYKLIKRFDIVVVDKQDSNNLVIKRIIGLPGEEIKYEEGKLYVNGKYVKEEFVSDTSCTCNPSFPLDSSFCTSSIVLSEDEYFIMGDNRNNSNDSRSYGPINKDQIVAKAIIINKTDIGKFRFI